MPFFRGAVTIKKRLFVSIILLGIFVAFLFGFSNCGKIDVMRPGAVEQPILEPIHPDNPDDPGDQKGTGPDCIDLARTVDGLDPLLHKWGTSGVVTKFELGSQEVKKFCLTTVQNGALVANVREVAPCNSENSELTIEFRDQNGKLGGDIPPKFGNNYDFGHIASVIGNYTVTVKQLRTGCRQELTIWQYYIDPSTKDICINGTWPLDSLGQVVHENVRLSPGIMKSYCMRIPEEAVALTCNGKNRCAYPGGWKRMYVRHTNLEKYPQLVSVQVSGEIGLVGFTQKMGGCGLTFPGCPGRLPGGIYEMRAEGLSDQCEVTELICFAPN